MDLRTLSLDWTTLTWIEFVEGLTRYRDAFYRASPSEEQYYLDALQEALQRPACAWQPTWATSSGGFGPPGQHADRLKRTGRR